MSRFMRFSAPMIGLDVQRDAVRMIRAKKTKKGIQFDCVAAVHLQHNVFNGEKIIAWDALQAAVVELVLTYQLQGAKTAICLPERLVIKDVLPCPADRSQIPAILLQALGQKTEGQVESWEIDFSIQPNGQMTYAATQRDYLAQYIQCIHAAGLIVRVVDVDVDARKRAVEYGLQHEHAHADADAFMIATGLALRGVMN